MKTIGRSVSFLAILVVAASLVVAAVAAMSADPPRSPAALAAFLAGHGGELAAGPPPPEVGRELDRLCGQHDCWTSRLYWHTDLAQAEAVAHSEGKLILSLRLLGRLDEELSCANSRFFRTVLYADPRVADELRRNFVLHWQSVRPVPKLTVDFGDGRKIVGTLTGNSIHYVLDAQGRPIDALPGLWSAPAFLRRLVEARSVSPASSPAELLRRLSTPAVSNDPSILPGSERRRLGDFKALIADGRALSKSMVERPLLGGTPLPIPLTSRDDRQDAKLSAPSIALIRAQNPGLDAAAMARLVGNFELALAADSAGNESDLRPRVLQILAQGGDLETLNDRVYAEVFLTPRSDPWLGLASPDVYGALAGNGVVADR